MKTVLTYAPVLIALDFDKPLKLVIDGSNSVGSGGLGTVR